MDAVNVTVELRSWFNALSANTRPYLAIDGTAHRRTWGTHQLVLSIGTHRIEAWYPTLLVAKTCFASIDLDIEPGATYRLRYRPGFPFGAGSMKLVAAELPAARVR
jgi:hypothetical protein